MKNTITIFTILLLGFASVLFLAKVAENSKDLSGIGECVESNAYLEGFQGTSKEKWDIFAEYCKSEIRKEK